MKTEELQDTLNRTEILALALQIDLEVKRLYRNGFRHEEEITTLVSENLNLDMSNNVNYELTLQSFTNQIRNINW